MTEPEHIQVSANGLTFGALAWGDADAPLALLVHGYPDTAWTWRHLGPYLATRGWRAIAPFTRGYAPTDLAPDDRYRVADLASDITALHAALGGDNLAVLIGHDWGAIAAYAVAETAPDMFAQIVTIAAPPPALIIKPFTSIRTVGVALRQARMSWYFAYNQMPGSTGGQSWLIPRLWRAWSPGYDGHGDVARTLQALDSPARRRAAARYYRNNLQGGLRATFTVRPSAPVLYLHGARDGCLQSGIVKRYAEALPPGSHVDVVPGVGHFLHLEDPQRVAQLIVEWIEPG